MVGIKDPDIPLLRLLTFIQSYSLIELQRNHRLYQLIILCIKLQRTQGQTLNKNPGPLIKLLMKSSDCYRRRCVLEDHTPSKPLSRIELLMESPSTPLPVLPQLKLVENTTKYNQSKLDMDKLGQDWTSPQQFVTSLVPLKYHNSKSQYCPTQNISPLDADTSQIDISSRGKYMYSVLIKNMKVWEKTAYSLVAINSHADLFSSTAYQCLQQESILVNALSRLLESVAKSIKHATAMSTILAIAFFQAQQDAAIASSKILLDHSSYALRSTPVNYSITL